MDTKIKNYLGWALIGGIIFSVGAGVWYVNSFSQSAPTNRNFFVAGEGKVVAVPDVAELTFGVLTEGGKNLGELQKENSEKINKVIAFLKENNIEEKDIKTQYYNISPRYQYFSCPFPLAGESVACPPAEIVGYSINQNVLVKIRDLSKVGDVLAGVVKKGANNVSGPNFTVDDPTELQNKAREEAISKAKQKAQAIAKSAGFRLGKLVSISENSFPQPMPYMMESAFGKGGGPEISPSIEPGSQEITANVSLTYEIK
ncbi:MAG: SIMPL domain-containing protein [Patescibacteria group bacterium]